MTIKFYSIIILWSHLHPFHVSVCDINHEEQQNLLEITIKIFADDLERALSDANKQSVTLKSSNISDRIKTYIDTHFTITVNKKPSSYQYLGWEMEGDAVWVYVECPLEEPLQNLEVKNSILTEVFDDQTNLVHLHSKNTTKSIQITGDETTKGFDNIDAW